MIRCLTCSTMRYNVDKWEWEWVNTEDLHVVHGRWEYTISPKTTGFKVKQGFVDM